MSARNYYNSNFKTKEVNPPEVNFTQKKTTLKNPNERPLPSRETSPEVAEKQISMEQATTVYAEPTIEKLDEVQINPRTP